MKKLTLAALAVMSLASPAAFAQQFQNRVNLEDVNIQGEANKRQSLFQNRNRFGLDDRIRIRRDFRREMEESIPPSFTDLPADLIAEKSAVNGPRAPGR